MFILFLLPSWGEFAILSLLLVYYARVHEEAKTHQKGSVRVILWYLAVNAVFLSIVLLLSFTARRHGVRKHIKHVIADVYVITLSVLHGLMPVCIAVYGKRFTDVANQRNIQLLPASPRIFRLLNLVIMIVYMLRTVFG
jgi:hypothetical protein